MSKQLAGVVFLALVIYFSGVTAHAQDQNANFDLFTGYSYMSDDTGFDRAGNHGYNIQLTANVHDNVGLTVDFSGHHGSPTPFEFTEVDVTNPFTQVSRHNTDIATLLFGPTLIHHAGNLRMFAHFLVGGVRARNNSTFLVTDEDNTFVQRNQSVYSGTGFAAGAGGGLDWSISERFGVRVLQLDYIYANPEVEGTQTFVCCSPASTVDIASFTERRTLNNIRMSTGILIHLGGW